MACKDINLIRVFFDCIGPEDSKLLVHYRNAQKETMLHLPVMFANFDVVKLLLEVGADPGSRDINGQTAYVKLLTWTVSKNISQIALLQGLMALMKIKQFSLEDANKVLALLEEIGGDASAQEDNCYSKEEVENIHSHLRSVPLLGKLYNPIKIANTQMQISSYMDSNRPYVSKLKSISDSHILVMLVRSLTTWVSSRKEGLIPLDSLPEGWTEFFEEANQEMNGLLTSWMQEDEIPELTKLLKDNTISACEWAVNKNGPLILLLVSRIIQEFTRTGAAHDLEEDLPSILITAWKVYQEDFHISWQTQVFALQRLKRIWRAINQGEILDLFYKLAVLLNLDQSLTSLNDYTFFQPLRTGPQTPSWALDNLSLSKKYPKATIFITTKHFLLPHNKIVLFIIQLAIFLLPPLLFVLLPHLKWSSMRYNSSFLIIATYLIDKIFPADWVLIDNTHRLHPNILRGFQAAWELIAFRARHGFGDLAEEPLILSISSKTIIRVDIPARLDSMRKNTNFPIYWLSLNPEDVATPVPCYAAMGEVMTKWKNGRLPRNAWGDGWWELEADGGAGWKRINVTERPTWSDYSKASREIKVSGLENNVSLKLDQKLNHSRSIYLQKTVRMSTASSLKSETTTCKHRANN